LQSGEGITARQIPQSDLWALATLDNRAKRMVLEEVLQALNYSSADIHLVLAELPDPGIRRRHGPARPLRLHPAHRPETCG
jgi:hypothetical protein